MQFNEKRVNIASQIEREREVGREGEGGRESRWEEPSSGRQDTSHHQDETKSKERKREKKVHPVPWQVFSLVILHNKLLKKVVLILQNKILQDLRGAVSHEVFELMGYLN